MANLLAIGALAGCGQGAATAPRTVSPSTDHASLSADADADSGHGTVAVWRLDPRSKPAKSSRRVAALVSRLACSGGESGQPETPSIEFDGSRVIVTFRTPPLPPDAFYTCQGNEEVPYRIRLPRSLGKRALFDGQCLHGPGAKGTAYCRPSGWRYSVGRTPWAPPWVQPRQ